MADPRPSVRERAGRELTGRGAAAIVPLGDSLRGTTAGGKVEAIWALSVIPDPAALPPLRSALADANEEVTCAAARALAMRADRGAEPGLARLLLADRPRVRLAAAEALARCGGPESVPAIWHAVAADPDRFLNHALVHAAHRLANVDAEVLEAALARPEPAVQAAALRLMDQPPRPRGLLAPGPVIARASSPDAGLRRAALFVLKRHPEWSDEALDYLRRELGAPDLPEDRIAALADLILAFQDRAAVQDLLARAAADAAAPAGRRAWALATMARSRLAPLPGPWFEALAGSLRDAQPSIRRAAVRAAAVLQVPGLDATLLALADEPGEPPDLRLEALRAALPRHPEPSPAAFALLIGQLGGKDNPLAALAAGELAGRARLDDSRRLRLLDAVRGHTLITPPMLARPSRRRSARRPPRGGSTIWKRPYAPAGGRRRPASSPSWRPSPPSRPSGGPPC